MQVQGKEERMGIGFLAFWDREWCCGCVGKGFGIYSEDGDVEKVDFFEESLRPLKVYIPILITPKPTG